jgi:hypothetical protein
VYVEQKRDYTYNFQRKNLFVHPRSMTKPRRVHDRQS